jgi:uncharacterized protein
MIREVFADTGYWIAILHVDDDLHVKAQNLSKTIQSIHLITSEMVLTEVLNYFAGFGAHYRAAVVELIEGIKASHSVTVIMQDSLLFEQSVVLYGDRLDKEWGLTDCASMILMNDRNITDILAYDHHFLQAGFRALLRDG